MNVADTIREKVFHLPPKAQEEVLRQVEQIEERYHSNGGPGQAKSGGDREIYGMWQGREITKEEYRELDHNERIDFGKLRHIEKVTSYRESYVISGKLVFKYVRLCASFTCASSCLRRRLIFDNKNMVKKKYEYFIIIKNYSYRYARF